MHEPLGCFAPPFEKKGMPIGAYDALIAATALVRGLIVVTSNTAEFQRVGGLGLEYWRV